MNITHNEYQVLRALLTNDYTSYNGAIPGADYTYNSPDWMVWTNSIQECCRESIDVTSKAFSAVCSSLKQKGLIRHDTECTWLTAEGFAIAMQPRA